jgi:DmsE family decaheme c-type cytochrome
VEAGGDLSLSLELLPAIESAQRCLGCHGTSHRVSGFRNSPHGRNNVACIQCHTAHPDRPGLQLVKAAPNDLCVQCHRTVQADFRKPFHHPVLEGAMQCIDCHNPHVWELGKNEQLVVGSKESCVSCHSEKRGPFVFEHPPVRVNGCQQCHQPHGAFNSKLLNRTQVHQLCLECHSMTPNIAVAQPPAFHDIRSSRFRNCTLCHREIHGSNAHRAFLR